MEEGHGNNADQSAEGGGISPHWLRSSTRDSRRTSQIRPTSAKTPQS
jgi:hypothetical protein